MTACVPDADDGISKGSNKGPAPKRASTSWPCRETIEIEINKNMSANSSAHAFVGIPSLTSPRRQRHSQPSSRPPTRRPTQSWRDHGLPVYQSGSWRACTRNVRLGIISTQMGARELMLTVDRCGYGEGACAARVDVAEVV